ncbi:hypothetical protein ACFWTC_03315 [Streptomyces sp. NPDC058619]|uniref:hypothetical protein n=1 Tax=unclassified Streptomyces TaxID=2593676 RepID=UPI00364E7309
MTTPTYPTGRWTALPRKCGGCGVKALPIGGPEGGAILHKPSCTVRRPEEPVEQ